MSGSLIPNGKQQYLDANGAPLAGGKVYYYIPYTTTAKNTWQDINLTILNTNPIILDSAGECIAWGSGAYRQQVYDVNDNLIWDQYTYGISPAGSNFISQEEVQTATQGQIVFTLTTITYVPGINSLVVFVNGSKQVTGTNYTETAGNAVTFVTGLNAGDVVDFYASLPATAQNMSNAVNVAYVPPFPASATTNVQAKLAQTISVKDFGAVGDGTTNDTAAIQNAINALPAGGILDGLGLTYAVTTCNLKSYMTLQNFSFFTIAGSTDFVSPVTIGAYYDTSTKSNINIYNVYINGNRNNQTNILFPSAEDGGRHGFRIIGNTNDILIKDCSATYCATDGIAIYGGVGTSPATPAHINITVENCKFEWNRRHGGSFDSSKNIKFINCIFNNNGQTTVPGAGFTDGGYGANTGTGTLYGNGFDIENSGAGGQSLDVLFDGCVAKQNVMAGILCYDPSDPTSPSFFTNKNFSFRNCRLDKGTSTDQYALLITGNISTMALGNIYEGIYISDCYLENSALFRSCYNVTINGGRLGTGSSTYCGVVEYATKVVLNTFTNNTPMLISTGASVTYTYIG